MGRFQLRRALLRRLSVLALCLMTPGAFAQDDTFALDVAFDHYFEGLTPNADGVYVVEPGVVLKYRVAIDLANTKISAGDKADARVWWLQGAMGVVIEQTADSAGDFFSVLPATGASDVKLQQLLDVQKSADDVEFFEEFFRALAWSKNEIFGFRRAMALLSAGGRISDIRGGSTSLMLNVSRLKSARLVHPAGAAARLEHPTGDRLVLFGILVPTNADSTGAMEINWTLITGRIFWVHRTVTGLSQFTPNSIKAQPLRVRFASREPVPEPSKSVSPD